MICCTRNWWYQPSNFAMTFFTAPNATLFDAIGISGSIPAASSERSSASWRLSVTGRGAKRSKRASRIALEPRGIQPAGPAGAHLGRDLGAHAAPCRCRPRRGRRCRRSSRSRSLVAPRIRRRAGYRPRPFWTGSPLPWPLHCVRDRGCSQRRVALADASARLQRSRRGIARRLRIPLRAPRDRVARAKSRVVVSSTRSSTGP